MQMPVNAAEWLDVMDARCNCIYCEEARWLKGRKPYGVRRMMIILMRHHNKEKAAVVAATV